MGKDCRTAKRMEQAYLDRHSTVCLVCGRPFWKRKGQFCTTACKLKAEAQEGQESKARGLS